MESQQVHGIYDRIRRSILSCESLLQLETTEKLIALFHQQNISPELNEKLNSVFLNKAATLHYFEWKRFRDGDLEAA
ncbi:hypothetical protein BH09BAC5_BH09BAC5_17880 [soil metagenome]